MQRVLLTTAPFKFLATATPVALGTEKTADSAHILPVGPLHEPSWTRGRFIQDLSPLPVGIGYPSEAVFLVQALGR